MWSVRREEVCVECEEGGSCNFKGLSDGQLQSALFIIM